MPHTPAPSNAKPKRSGHSDAAHSTKGGALVSQSKSGKLSQPIKAVPAASGKWNRDGLPNSAKTDGGYPELGGVRGRGGKHD